MKQEKNRKVVKKTNSDWEYPVCDNCGSDAFSVLFDKVGYWQHSGKFRIVTCSNCRLVFVHPRPKLADIGQYYPKESYWGQNIAQQFLSTNWQQQRAKGYDFLYKLISQYLPMSSVLDIGAGTGVFLSWFKEQGCNVAGVELSKDAVRFARQVFNIRLLQGDFLDFSFAKNSYDLVTLNNVLEHLHQPFKTLSAVHNVLRPKGLLIITVPNIDSLGIQLFGKTSHLLQPPRHLYHFSGQTLSNMLNKTGFRVIGIDHGYWEHNYYSIFESFRLKFSPKFNQSSVSKNIQLEKESAAVRISVFKEAIKLLIKGISFCIVVAELALRRSEVITVYATKKSLGDTAQ